MEKEDKIQDQNNFVKEVKIAFSNKSKTTDTEQKIKTFIQRKKYITNFIIEFETLVIKTRIDDIHTIFLLKKNIKSDISRLYWNICLLL